MPKDLLDFTKSMADRLADDPEGEVKLSGPPSGWKPEDNAPVERERKFRVKKRGVLGSAEDRIQNDLLQEVEKQHESTTGKKLGRAPQSLDKPEDYGPALTSEERTAKNKQALKSVMEDEASGFGAIKRRRAEYKQKLNATINTGMAWKSSMPRKPSQDLTLGNLETASIHPELPRQVKTVFNEKNMGEHPRFTPGSKEQQALWELRLKTIGKSAAEDTPSTPKSLTNLIKGVKTASSDELKDLAKRIDKGGREGTQVSIDNILRAKANPIPTGKDMGPEEVTLSGKAKGSEGVKQYSETVPTPVKPEVHTKDMLSKLSAPKPLEAEVKLSGASKIVKAVEAGEGAVSLASKSSRLAELLGKGAGKAGIAALLIGGGMAGLRKLGEKLKE